MALRTITRAELFTREKIICGLDGIYRYNIMIVPGHCEDTVDAVAQKDGFGAWTYLKSVIIDGGRSRYIVGTYR